MLIMGRYSKMARGKGELVVMARGPSFPHPYVPVYTSSHSHSNPPVTHIHYKRQAHSCHHSEIEGVNSTANPNAKFHLLINIPQPPMYLRMSHILTGRGPLQTIHRA